MSVHGVATLHCFCSESAVDTQETLLRIADLEQRAEARWAELAELQAPNA